MAGSYNCLKSFPLPPAFFGTLCKVQPAHCGLSAPKTFENKPLCELILQGASDLNLNVTKRNIFNHIKCKAGRPNRHCDRRHPFSKQFSYRRVTAKTKFLFDHLWSYHSGGYNLLIRVCCNACPLWRSGNRHNCFTKSLWILSCKSIRKISECIRMKFHRCFCFNHSMFSSLDKLLSTFYSSRSVITTHWIPSLTLPYFWNVTLGN